MSPWFYLAIVSLSIGGLLALLVAIARTPILHSIFPEGYFYHALAGHVDLAIVVFLLSFSVFLWERTFKKVSNISFLFAFSGFLNIALSSLLGHGKVVSNNYLPTIDDALFLAGAGFFFFGFWLATIELLPKARPFSKDPIIHFPSIAIILSFIMLISFLLSIPKAGSKSELYAFYERLYWAPGHIQQFLNGAMLLYFWYFILARNSRIGILRLGGLIFIIASGLQAIVPIIFNDPISKNAKIFSEILYAVGLGIPIILHLLSLSKNLKPRFAETKSVGAIMSMLLFSLGAIIAYAGLDADLRIPAHYHGMVTAITLGFMTLSYDALSRFNRLTLTQVYLYSSGMVLFVIGLYFAGLLGAPRKTFGTAFTENPAILISLGVMGFGTALAVAGGVLFVSYLLYLALKRVLEEGRSQGAG
ncbi:MAG: cytochrome C oxidase subunit I [Aquificaceae bacterium]|nr:cytochrome C oxidase subunit I [Aquificaceae bacterium]